MDLVADSKSRSETAPLPPPVPGSRRHRILTSVVNGLYPLHSACVWENSRAAHILLHYGADPNVVSACGRTPLMIALGKDDAITAQLLLAYKADIHQKDVSDTTPLEYAVSEFKVPLISAILTSGVPVSYGDVLNYSKSLNKDQQEVVRTLYQTISDKRCDEIARLIHSTVDLPFPYSREGFTFFHEIASFLGVDINCPLVGIPLQSNSSPSHVSGLTTTTPK